MGSIVTERESYIIVGAGAWGSSLALHTIRAHPSASVTLIDKCEYPSHHAASHDLNKVVRADYVDPLYMELGLESIDSWKNDPLYKPFYHKSQTAMVADARALAAAMNENYKSMGTSDRLRTVTPTELASMWDGLHAGADMAGVEGILVNDDNGWAESANTVAAVVKAAIDAGVRYHVADVHCALLDGNGAARGVVTEDGTELLASRVIFAAGATTSRLLADTCPAQRDMHARDLLVATGFAACTVQLTDAEVEAFKDAPIFIHSTGDVNGGVLPCLQERKLKFYQEITFTNTVHHKSSGGDITMPVFQSTKTTSKLSPVMEGELWKVIEGIYGNKSRHWKLEDGHICWDAITPHNDFVVCRHPRINGLYVMAGGAFHGFKFMPVMGKYALQMLEGKLPRKLAEAWSWTPLDKPPAYPVEMPSREMRDMC